MARKTTKKTTTAPKAEKPARQPRKADQDDGPVEAGEWNGPKPGFLEVSAT